jgi:cell pole-organizing protein PopZ
VHDPLIDEPATTPPLGLDFASRLEEKDGSIAEAAAEERLKDSSEAEAFTSWKRTLEAVEERPTRFSRSRIRLAGEGHPAKSAECDDDAAVRSSASVSNLLLQRQMRAVLEPLLREWMDENLPALVEELVREELQRAGIRAVGGRVMKFATRRHA